MKILNKLVVLTLVALLMACSMKKPGDEPTVSNFHLTVNLNTDKDGNGKQGFDTYIAVFQVDFRNISSDASGKIPKVGQFTSTITFENSKKTIFEQDVYTYQPEVISIKGPEQKLGGVTYEQYMKNVVPAEVVNGIVNSPLGGAFNENKINLGVNSGNSWLNSAVSGNKAEGKFVEKGVAYDKVGYQTLTYRD